MSSNKVSYYIETNNVMISKYHLCFLYVLISWSLIYLFIFVTQPNWVTGNNGYLTLILVLVGTGTNTSEGKPGKNTLLSDIGRENILWVSFLFALIGRITWSLFSFIFNLIFFILEKNPSLHR